MMSHLNGVCQHVHVFWVRSMLSAWRCYLFFVYHIDIIIVIGGDVLLPQIEFYKLFLLSTFVAIFIGVFFLIVSLGESFQTSEFLFNQLVCSDLKPLLDSFLICCFALHPGMLFYLLKGKPITGLKGKHLRNKVFEVWVTEKVFVFTDLMPSPKLVYLI